MATDRDREPQFIVHRYAVVVIGQRTRPRDMYLRIYLAEKTPRKVRAQQKKNRGEKKEFAEKDNIHFVVLNVDRGIRGSSLGMDQISTAWLPPKKTRLVVVPHHLLLLF